MLRLIWLIFSLGVYGYVFLRGSPWPNLAYLILAAVSVVFYFFGWVVRRGNHLALFFATGCFLSICLEIRVGSFWTKMPKTYHFIPDGFVKHVIMILAMFFIAFLTFANYRATQNLKTRRGNLREPRKPEWRWLKNRFRKKDEILLDLGIEVDWKRE